MSDTKIFSLGDNGGASNNAALIASLCQQRGLDPNMVAAMMNNRGGNGGWGDGSAWWIIILLIFGWGGFGNGFGGGFGGRGSAQGLADLGNLVNNDAGRELLMSAIQGNGTAISQLASTVHCDYNALSGSINALCAQFNTLGLGQRDIITAITQGNNSVLTQLCDCCCGIKTLVTTQGYEGQLRTIQQTNDIVQNATSNTNVIAAKIDAQTQMINDRFCQLEMREMQRELQTLRDERTQYQMSALLQQQSQNLINTIRPCPVPSYLVCNPWGCQGNGYGYGFAYNDGGCNGCGNC